MLSIDTDVVECRPCNWRCLLRQGGLASGKLLAHWMEMDRSEFLHMQVILTFLPDLLHLPRSQLSTVIAFDQRLQSW